MRYWIKLYTEITRDPKMGRLSDRQFRTCINLFALAGEKDADGQLPAVSDVAWTLRMAESDLLEDLAALAAVDIIEETEPGLWRVRKWTERQAKPPSGQPEAVGERVAKHRRNKRNSGESNEGVTALQGEGNEGVTSQQPQTPPELLSPQVQTFLTNGGRLPFGALADGTPRKARAIQYITEHVKDDPASLELWGRVVAAYCMQWSPKSYTVMVTDFYEQNRVPGETSKRNGRPNGNGKLSPALEALRRAQAKEERAEATYGFAN